jgi:hypothetical protein
MRPNDMLMPTSMSGIQIVQAERGPYPYASKRAGSNNRRSKIIVICLAKKYDRGEVMVLTRIVLLRSGALREGVLCITYIARMAWEWTAIRGSVTELPCTKTMISLLR